MMNRTILYILLVGAFGCGDCGEDTSVVPGFDLGTQLEEDMGDAPDAAQVVTNFPAFLEIAVNPGRTTYATGQSVTTNVTVFDAFGDVAQYETQIVIGANDSLSADGTYELLAEGPLTFTACTLAPGLDGDVICNTDTIIVDDAAPTLELTFPPAGAELDSTAFSMIPVSGTVTDTYGTPRVFVNGVEVAIVDGGFEFMMTPKLGVNHIQVEATDGLSDKLSTVAADVMWAHDYLETNNGEPDIFFDDALQFRLGQSMLDDGTAPVINADGSTSFADISDVIKLVVETLDASALIPDPAINNPPSMVLRIPNADFGGVISQVVWTSTGLELFLGLPNVRLDTLGQVTIGAQSLSLDGYIDAGVAAVVQVSITKNTPASPVVVTVNSAQVAIESMASNFQSAEANAVFLIAAGALRTTLETLVVDLLNDLLLAELPAVFQSLFQDLDDALQSNDVSIDTGFGNPLTLQLLGGFNSIDLSSQSHMDVVTRLRAIVSEPGIHDSRGIPILEPTPTPEFFQSDIEIGLRLALVNGILSILWDAGILDLDISAQIPIAVDNATITAKLPPVIRPPTLGEPNTFVIELGQLELSTDVLGRSDVYGIFLSTGLDLSLDGTGIKVTVAQDPIIRTWVISSSESTSLLTPAQLEGLIATELWPEVQSALSDGIALPIPEFDLSSLAGVSASFAGATLQIESGRVTQTRSGYAMIEGVLEGFLP